MIDKLYYGIGEVSQIVGVPQSMIRFWLHEFGITIKKRRHNYMFFTPGDLETIKEINYLLKVRKFTIEGAKQEMEPWDYSNEIKTLLRVG